MKRRMLAMAAIASLVCGGAGAMELSSPNIKDGAALPLDQVKNDCGGRNVSPALSWSGAPPSAESFAVTVYDPDAQGGWWHWIVVDIPVSVHALPAGAGNGSGLPKGAVQGQNDFGDAAYGGACPPPGAGWHSYNFTVWAVPKAHLPFAADAKPDEIGSYLKFHAVAHASLVAIYER